jgi:hypothetical protein
MTDDRADDRADDAVPARMTMYSADADLRTDAAGRVANHDELVDEGKTKDVVRAVSRAAAEAGNLDVVRPGHPAWDERLRGIEHGDEWELSELVD